MQPCHDIRFDSLANDNRRKNSNSIVTGLILAALFGIVVGVSIGSRFSVGIAASPPPAIVRPDAGGL